MSNLKTSWYIDLLTLGIFFLVIFLIFLGAHHLVSPDETRYVGISWDMFQQHNYITPKLAGVPFLGKPILYYWLNILSFSLLGVSEFSARLAPALSGIITCLFSYIAMRKLYTRRLGLLSALLVAAAPMSFALWNYANMDGEVASWITCSLLAFLVGCKQLDNKQHSATWFYIAYFFAALAFLTKGLIGFAFPAIIIFAWLLVLNDWKYIFKIRLLSGLCLFLVIVLPWLIICEKINPGFLKYFFLWNQFDRYLSANFNQHEPWYFYLPALIGATFPFVFYIIQSYAHHFKSIITNRKESKVELFLILWVVLITLFFSIPQSKLIGYIGSAIPPTAILMALYLDKKLSQLPNKANKISSYLCAIIFIVTALVLLMLPFISHSKAVIASIPYARALIVILIVASGCLIYSLHTKKYLNKIVLILITSSFLLNITLIASLKTFDLQLNWPIADKVKPYLKEDPNAIVLMYGRYYYSIPMYLDRNVPTVANWDKLNVKTMGDDWKREIFEGVIYQPKLSNGAYKLPDTLMTNSTFMRLWDSPEQKTIILISSTKPTDAFAKLLGKNKYKVLARVPRRGVYIITNNLNLGNGK